ncbi:cysteine desulfuration protein SufE [Rhodospirillum rubrum]|nr:cysteine desulfuration protein SufE [Rhodospirillum rubrum]MBK1678181.1 cysteine desulfuration protein SufE [Rhodospirillum rubrum]
MSDMPQMTLDDLAENFALFDDWEDRYRYIIDLGKKLPPMPEAEKTEASKVRGCMSQVWLVVLPDPGPPKRLSFHVDSDAHIVRGLAAVMMIIFSGRTPEEILAIDADGIFARLGLDSHISPNRRNGVASMIATIQAMARAA